MTSASPRANPAPTFFQRQPWNRRWFWLVLSAVILATDYLCGPLMLFPILFIFPVTLAGWNRATREAVLIAILLTVVRFGYRFAWDPAWAIGADTFNAVVHGVVLVALGVLTSRVAAQNAQLAQHVKQLEGLIPICAHCKRILDHEKHWTRLETYIVEHSQAEFTHDICPECAKKYYGLAAPNEASF